jgi:hypothetical protein
MKVMKVLKRFKGMQRWTSFAQVEIFIKFSTLFQKGVEKKKIKYDEFNCSVSFPPVRSTGRP